MDNSKSTSSVIKVSFFEPVGGKTDYLFGSLKAIYTVFSQKEVGCSLTALYAAKFGSKGVKVTDKCRITKEPVTRYPQTNTK